MEHKSYAGIGSRETPQDILDLMRTIGEYLAKKGYTLRSGGAGGADIAFEEGCDRAQGNKEIYLPWKGFNKSPSEFYLQSNAKSKEAEELAKKFHPAWNMLTPAARKLMARNGMQVLGPDLNTPVSFVVCWTKQIWAPGKNVGGTGQALRIAYSRDIPILNLRSPETIADINDHMYLGIDFLESTSYNLFEE